MEKDTDKLWKLTKLLNGNTPEKAQTVLQSEGEPIVQKEAANCLAKLHQRREQCQATEGKNMSSQRAASTAAEAAHIRQLHEPALNTSLLTLLERHRPDQTQEEGGGGGQTKVTVTVDGCGTLQSAGMWVY